MNVAFGLATALMAIVSSLPKVMKDIIENGKRKYVSSSTINDSDSVE